MAIATIAASVNARLTENPGFGSASRAAPIGVSGESRYPSSAASDGGRERDHGEGRDLDREPLPPRRSEHAELRRVVGSLVASERPNDWAASRMPTSAKQDREDP